MGYDPSTTAILLVDPYNDFLSDGGKLWPRVKAVAEEVKLLGHLREVIAAARARGLRIVFVPHHRWTPGDYVSFDNPSPYQLGSAKAQVFARDSWGGTFHDDFLPQPGDLVVGEHWGSSGFANTDLDLQLKQHGIRRVILIGMIANTNITLPAAGFVAIWTAVASVVVIVAIKLLCRSEGRRAPIGHSTFQG